jgi:putative DNA primase/helicase
MVNAETGMVEVMPPRVVENTFPWFVNRAQALSPDAPDAQAIESLIADGVVYLGNIEMDRLLGVINEYTGVTKQRLRTSESNAKKVLMQSGRMPGGGVPVGDTLTQVEPDNQGQAGVVSEQGVPVAGELPRLAVGDYMHVYPDTLPLADRIQVKPTTDNLIGLLEYTRIGVFFNKMTKRVVIDDHGMYGFGVKDADGIKTRLTDLMIRCGMSDARSKEMIRETAMMNQYHPVVGYLSGAVWDGVDRFEEVMRCLTTDDPIHFEKVFRRWLVSIVAAVFGYGKIPPRGVLTFVGNQYIGKTSFLKKLSPQVPGSFKEGIHLSLSGFGETDSVRKSTTALLVELGELDATFRKSDIAALKAFIGRDTDEYRLPYGTDFVEWPRQTVFAASVNHSEFLQDTTGNTRFWTVGVSSINLDAMSKIDNRQLWLQIKGWYDQGEAWTMTRQEMQQVEDKNAEHREIGVLEEELLTYFDWDDPVYVAGKPWSSATGRGENAVIRMTAREIARKIGMENLFGSANKFNRDLSTALKVLTGMQTPYKTKINRKIVRVWFLPRMLDVSGNVQPHGRIH